jgi:hypothetical protein
MTAEITAGGISVPLTHAGKVLFPADGLTKEHFPHLRRAALWARELLDGELGLTSSRYGLGEAGKRLAKLAS